MYEEAGLYTDGALDCGLYSDVILDDGTYAEGALDGALISDLMLLLGSSSSSYSGSEESACGCWVGTLEVARIEEAEPSLDLLGSGLADMLVVVFKCKLV